MHPTMLEYLIAAKEAELRELSGTRVRRQRERGGWHRRSLWSALHHPTRG
jgi:hypothetical protein